MNSLCPWHFLLLKTSHVVIDRYFNGTQPSTYFIISLSFPYTKQLSSIHRAGYNNE